MLYVWITALVLLNLIWLVLVVFGLPGTWMIVGSVALFAWWQPGVFSLPTIGIMAAMALMGEAIEFLGGWTGAQKTGAGKRGAQGALIGGLAGALMGTALIPTPVLGTVIGSCAGAGVGAWILESVGNKNPASGRIVLGAGLGRLVGVIGKLAAGIAIWLIATAAAYWP